MKFLCGPNYHIQEVSQNAFFKLSLSHRKFKKKKISVSQMVAQMFFLSTGLQNKKELLKEFFRLESSEELVLRTQKYLAIHRSTK